MNSEDEKNLSIILNFVCILIGSIPVICFIISMGEVLLSSLIKTGAAGVIVTFLIGFGFIMLGFRGLLFLITLIYCSCKKNN